MAIPAVGSKAPDFTVTGADGQRHTLSAELKQGPLFLFFWKTECPVCEMTLPFLERFQKAYVKPGGPFRIVGVAQNPAKQAEAFAREHGDSFPQWSDAEPYEASEKYGLVAVPSYFLVGTDGKILDCGEGWSRSKLNAISKKVAGLVKQPAVDISTPGDGAPETRPG